MPVWSRESTVYEKVIRIGWTENKQGCWIFNGAKTTAGYGSLTYHGGRYYAHRVVLAFHQDLSPGLVAGHVCDVPACVRPEHLVVMTQHENVRDMINKDRSHKNIQTCRSGKHAWIKENIYVQGGKMTCLLCKKETQKRYRAKRKVQQ